MEKEIPCEICGDLDACEDCAALEDDYDMDDYLYGSDDDA